MSQTGSRSSRSRAPILMYHKVGFRSRQPGDRKLNVPTERFRLHVRLLRALGYTGVTLSDASQGLFQGKPLPRRPVCITFDDGFRCVAENAVPILEEIGWPATVFVPAAFMGRTANWPGIEDWTPETIMDAHDLRRLHNLGWEISSHTRSHADLSSLEDEQALDEIRGGAADLGGVLCSPVRTFAYPYGRLNRRTRGLVRESGLLCAVTVTSGVACAGSDPYLLPRVKVASRDGAALFLYRLWLRPVLARRTAVPSP